MQIYIFIIKSKISICFVLDVAFCYSPDEDYFWYASDWDVDIFIDLWGYNADASLALAAAFSLIPWLIVLILSVVIPINLYRMKKKRNKMSSTNPSIQNREQKITVTFCVICISSLVLVSPDITMVLLYNGMYRYVMYDMDAMYMTGNIVFVLHVLAQITCGKNYFLYNITSSDFRLKNIEMLKSVLKLFQNWNCIRRKEITSSEGAITADGTPPATDDT